MRPLMVADPIFRAGSPDTVAAEICGAVWATIVVATISNATTTITAWRVVRESLIISFLYWRGFFRPLTTDH